MLSDDELPPLPDYLSPGSAYEYGRAVEQAAYERAAAHVRTLKRDWWRLRAAPEIVVEECAVAIEKLMTQEQPR